MFAAVVIHITTGLPTRKRRQLPQGLQTHRGRRLKVHDGQLDGGNLIN